MILKHCFGMLAVVSEQELTSKNKSIHDKFQVPSFHRSKDQAAQVSGSTITYSRAFVWVEISFEL
jgi:hypothetical protein